MCVSERQSASVVRTTTTNVVTVLSATIIFFPLLLLSLLLLPWPPPSPPPRPLLYLYIPITPMAGNVTTFFGGIVECIWLHCRTFKRWISSCEDVFCLFSSLWFTRIQFIYIQHNHHNHHHHQHLLCVSSFHFDCSCCFPLASLYQSSFLHDWFFCLKIFFLERSASRAERNPFHLSMCVFGWKLAWPLHQCVQNFWWKNYSQNRHKTTNKNIFEWMNERRGAVFARISGKQIDVFPIDEKHCGIELEFLLCNNRNVRKKEKTINCELLQRVISFFWTRKTLEKNTVYSRINVKYKIICVITIFLVDKSLMWSFSTNVE